MANKKKPKGSNKGSGRRQKTFPGSSSKVNVHKKGGKKKGKKKK